jgi:hypothetical protein
VLFGSALTSFNSDWSSQHINFLRHSSYGLSFYKVKWYKSTQLYLHIFCKVIPISCPFFHCTTIVACCLYTNHTPLYWTVGTLKLTTAWLVIWMLLFSLYTLTLTFTSFSLALALTPTPLFILNIPVSNLIQGVGIMSVQFTTSFWFI